MRNRNGHRIARTVLRDSLVAIPEIQTLVSMTGGYKIFWENVPDTIPLPYITLHHFSGGYEKDRRYYDGIWEIKGHTGNMVTSDELENAIDCIDNSWPVTTSFTSVCGYDTIDSMLPMFSRYVVKNRELFVVAGLYRLRLNLGDLP
jgi:hypothetical protein